MNMEHKGFTPGPWIIDEDSTGVLYFHDNLKFHICVMGSGGSTTLTRTQEVANAKLIADAPNLYAEVERLQAENKKLISVMNKIQADGQLALHSVDNSFVELTLQLIHHHKESSLTE